MTERRSARFLWRRAGLLSCGIAVAAVTVAACASATPPTGAHGAAGAPGQLTQPGPHPRVRVSILAIRDSLAACEQRIERGPRLVPTLAVAGASYTAGVGPGSPALSWAADLTRRLRWDAVSYGVPGAGYTRAGSHGLGPMARLLEAEKLARLDPALVLVQAGYDDGRVPAGTERAQVRRTIELIRAVAPHARIGLITVFTSPERPIPARFYRTDATIVAAARAADPRVIIMDPLIGHWKYARADGGLHPTAAGDAWIGRKVGLILRAHGIDGELATPGAPAPVVCNLGVGDSATGGAGT